MPRQINEELTRKQMIDPQLEKAGWYLRDHSKVKIEIPVDGYDAEPWNAVSDYCLYREKGTAMAGKYTPLEQYLRELPANQREATLGFDQIERILNAKLPSSAYEDQRWWEHETEGNHVNTRAWSNAGWKIESLDVDKRWVKLTRTGEL